MKHEMKLVQNQGKRLVYKGNSAGSKKKEKPEITNKYGVKVGDVFAFSFGYDATLYCFFRVIRIVSPTMAEVAEIGTKTVENEKTCGPCSWKSTPDVGEFKTTSLWYKGKTALKRVSTLRGWEDRGACLSFENGRYHAFKVNPEDVFDEDNYN